MAAIAMATTTPLMGSAAKSNKSSLQLQQQKRFRFRLSLKSPVRTRTRTRTRALFGVQANQSPKDKGPPPFLFDRFQGVIDQLFHHRIIRLGGPVEDDVANILVSQLLYLDALDPSKDIVMYINSPGGSVTAGMAIFDTMKHIRADVSTVCVGLAASMAAFILSAGTKGKRFSLPNARIMIHQPLGGTQGSQSDMEIQCNEVLHHRAVLSGYLAYNTGQPLEKIIEDTDRDFFMSAKEAKEYGIVDDVITNPLKSLQPQTISN
ncbi:ATP-dependent Clp protease proteolytic subunit [Rhynchospora pubera]|uniref:ATP-dependent Clp protease proteolytic subunit n=1 Tax=Rhynchospora pubera TaxID=906938 RepID=A0AAV8EYL0_9POAL|nr:ATP-dependent Clp protease proteolytic subunit [Rhynchospora pubera]